VPSDRNSEVPSSTPSHIPSLLPSNAPSDFPSSSPTEAPSPNKFCYVMEWVDDNDTAMSEIVRPLVGFPSAHAAVSHHKCKQEGDPIPHDGFDSECPFHASNSATAFYSLNSPIDSSSNTGFETFDAVTLYFVVDDKGKGLFVINYDKPHNPKTSEFSRVAQLDITSEGLAGVEGVTALVKDDATEFGNWDVASGSMIGAIWTWGACCTDGGVIGYLPSSDFCLNLEWKRLDYITAIQIGSYNTLNANMNFPVSLSPSEVTGGKKVRACAKLCTEVCSTYASKVECDNQYACGWCDGVCKPDYDEDGIADDCDPCPFGTCKPTLSPRPTVSGEPTVSVHPSASHLPSFEPSGAPSAHPTDAPSLHPSEIFSSAPSASPSSVPTPVVSALPSHTLSGLPSLSPSLLPSSTQAPSGLPSLVPSDIPSSQPSTIPSSPPSPKSLSVNPSAVPSSASSSIPSDVPTVRQSDEPSSMLSQEPSTSHHPSEVPINGPSLSPSLDPFVEPTLHHSAQPSLLSSSVPSSRPSGVPSDRNSEVPSSTPSHIPSLLPSNAPSDFPSSSPTEAPSPNKFCYVMEWVDDNDTAMSEIVRPLVGFPSAHAAVSHHKCKQEGDPIPHDGFDSECPFHASNSATAFYSLNSPIDSSSNTGFETFDAVTLYFVVDDKGKGLFVINYDKPHNPKTSEFSRVAQLDITSEGLAGVEGVTALVKDDATEFGNWDVASGSMIGAIWTWGACCTDGGVIGYLPSSDFCLNLEWKRLDYITAIQIGSYNTLNANMNFPVSLSPSEVTGGKKVRACAKLCTEVCSTYASKVECDNQYACGWCDGVCKPDYDEDGIADDCDPCPFGTCKPTLSPRPTVSGEPTVSVHPSASHLPSFEPSGAPSAHPTDAPSLHPSEIFSSAPSASPSSVPTPVVSALPSHTLSGLPSLSPSLLPSSTQAPSGLPSLVPSDIPSSQPSTIPSSPPSPKSLSVNPSAVPSSASSSIPSDVPTVRQSDEPSSMLSQEPSTSHHPSEVPIKAPSDIPSILLSSYPSVLPSAVPSYLPTKLPSEHPSEHPSALPSCVPISSNLALGKAATQSSSRLYDGDASLAVDGNTNGNFFEGSVTHSLEGDNCPWWQVDLCNSADVGLVRIYNRNDCCSDRLVNFQVEVLDSNENVVSFIYHAGTAGYVTDFTFERGTVGRFVKIDNYCGNVLSLAEVEVYANGPSSSPSSVPSKNPMSDLTLEPSTSPTDVPSFSPSRGPNNLLSLFPSLVPSTVS